MDTLTAAEIALLKYDWESWARDEQLQPPGDWITWLVKAGRGWGKTRTGAETARLWSKNSPYVSLIAPTADDARDIMIEGESGILATCPWWERPTYYPSKRRLVWPSGCISLIFTADEPDRLRGKQHAKLWADEVASWRYPEAWDQALLGLRLGTDPRAVVTTTPRPIKLIRDLVKDPTTLVTDGTTYDNRANLPPAFFHKVISKYEGTRLGRQELEGRLLDDNPDAIFKRGDIDNGRVKEAPQLDRIVVAVDPAATSAAASDETGIVANGVKLYADKDGRAHGYTLADRSMRAGPLEWARAAVKLYHDLKADLIVAEVNNGGEMVIQTIATVDPNVPVKAVSATRGKAVRAEPVGALYEQGRIHHVGSFPDLEDQMCEWNPADTTAKSPDRMDANVWAYTELMLQEDPMAEVLSYYKAQEAREAEARKNRPQPVRMGGAG